MASSRRLWGTRSDFDLRSPAGIYPDRSCFSLLVGRWISVCVWVIQGARSAFRRSELRVDESGKFFKEAFLAKIVFHPCFGASKYHSSQLLPCTLSDAIAMWSASTV